MVHSSDPSIIVRRWLSIFRRASWSMRASCISSSSRILRTSRRIVFRSSIKSTESISATASVTTWASLFTLSRLIRTAAISSRHERRSQYRLVLLYQLAFYLAKHLLIVRAALLHLLGIGLENHAHFIIDAVFEREFIEQRGVHLLRQGRRRLGLDETAGNKFFGNLAGQIAHILSGKKHVRKFFLGKESVTQG